MSLRATSLRAWVLLAVALVAVAGLVYAADHGGRRSIHHSGQSALPEAQR